jgi:hypothetical protein
VIVVSCFKIATRGGSQEPTPLEHCWNAWDVIDGAAKPPDRPASSWRARAGRRVSRNRLDGEGRQLPNVMEA